MVPHDWHVGLKETNTIFSELKVQNELNTFFETSKNCDLKRIFLTVVFKPVEIKETKSTLYLLELIQEQLDLCKIIFSVQNNLSD